MTAGDMATGGHQGQILLGKESGTGDLAAYLLQTGFGHGHLVPMNMNQVEVQVVTV